MFFVLIATSLGQRKNSESPQGIAPQTFGSHSHVLYLFTKLKTYQASFLFYNIKNCHQYTYASPLKGPLNSEKLSSLYPL